MTTRQFVKLTVQYTTEFAAESIVAAGGRGTAKEIEELTAISRTRHRVAVNNAATWIEAMAAHGYRVVDVAVCPPPIA